MTDGILLVGAGGMAKMIIEYLERDNIAISRIAVDRDYLKESKYKDYPITALEDEIASHRGGRALVAIGYSRMNRTRFEKCEKLREAGFEFINYISPRAEVYGAGIHGDNIIIMDRVVAEPLSSISEGCIVWPSAVLSHHVTLGPYCQICSGSIVAGHVDIGAFCFLGVNSAIRDGVRVAESTLVGMGAAITHDTSINDVFLPLPAAKSKRQSSCYFL